MADEGLKDFTVTWITGGLLVFCLLAFAITFIYNNNSDALNDGTEDIFNDGYTNFSNKLVATSEDSNSLLNITANTNPEVSDLGSRDSVAVGYSSTGSATSFFSSSKKLISWVFSGTSGTILLGVIGGLVGLLGVFFIWRFIKNGL